MHYKKGLIKVLPTRRLKAGETAVNSRHGRCWDESLYRRGYNYSTVEKTLCIRWGYMKPAGKQYLNAYVYKETIERDSAVDERW